MSDTLIKDTTKLVGYAISKTSEASEPIKWWMWLAIVEFGIIAFLIFKEKLIPKGAARQQLKKESLRQDIDFNNIINSSFNSMQLYEELKVKCHPDLFPTNKEKNVIAEKLFQEITKNKNNVKRLIELKKEAIQKLNINL